MKVRIGFVSNSSSSSFVIRLENITQDQLDAIINYETLTVGESYAEDTPWNFYLESGEITGTTDLDNFNMEEYLRNLGIPEEFIKWEY